MRSRHHDRVAFRSAARRPWVCGLALLWSMAFVLDGHAESLTSAWRAEAQIYVAGATSHIVKDDVTATNNVLATAGELKFSSLARPWHAGLIVEYEVSMDRRSDDMLRLGGYFRYDTESWDATVFMFAGKARGTQTAWLYLGRLRYRVAENHKVGVVATGSLGSAKRPAFALGYFGSISDSLSLNLIADPGFNNGPDFATHLALVWQVR